MERAEQEKKTKRLTDVLSAVIQKRYQSVVQKTELGVKAKLSIYWSISILPSPMVTYEITDTSSRDKLPLKVSRALS